MNKLTDKDVRIIYLPPATVASIHCVGNRPEDRATALLREFMQKTDLAKRKPDFRHYGFNHPNGSNEDDHGYEHWVTIPENMTVEAPFQKKRMPAGYMRRIPSRSANLKNGIGFGHGWKPATNSCSTLATPNVWTVFWRSILTILISIT